MADPQGVNVLKDVAIPLVAAAIGAVAAIGVGYYTVIKPQREQQKFEDTTARFAITAFLQSVKLAAATIIQGQNLGAMEGALRRHIASFIQMLPKLAAINHVLPDAAGQAQFFLMITELDRLGHSTVLDRHAVLFAYGTAATTGLLLRISEADDCAGVLAGIENSHEAELASFFRLVVDRVLPPDLREKVREELAGK